MITFSYLHSMSSADLLDLLRRFAKTRRKSDTSGNSLSWHQDQVAISLGFKNWSLLHKFLASGNWSDADKVLTLALKKAALGEFIEVHAVRTIDEDVATETMLEWARGKFTPLIDFAFYDNESPNGFSWPAVDMADELADEFTGQYPEELIRRIGEKLDADEGPWGLEEYGEPD